MRKFYFTSLLALTLVIAIAVKGITYIMPEKTEPTPSASFENDATSGKETDIADNIQETEDMESAQEEETVTTELTTQEEDLTEEDITEELTTEAPPVFGSEYFDDALFIGDSRTVGLSDYGDLGNAEVFADNGMSVYKIWKTDVTLKSGDKSKLEDVLKKKPYGKIYIMLGINELGYDFDQTVETYTEFIEDVHRMQPSAIIYIEGNMHVTKEKGAGSKFFNNERINEFNAATRKLADNSTIFYIDANEYFDDAEGNLAKEYTGDGTHIYAKHYAEWVDWILTKAVTP